MMPPNVADVAVWLILLILRLRSSGKQAKARLQVSSCKSVLFFVKKVVRQGSYLSLLANCRQTIFVWGGDV